MKLLLIGRDDDTGRRFALPDGETLIGRRPDCHIVLDAPAIAPRHARVFSVDGRTIIYGLTSEWPTYVNGDTVNRRVLEHGDDIELAHYTLRCVDEAGTGASGEAGADAAPAPESEGNEQKSDTPGTGAPLPDPGPDSDSDPDPEPVPDTLEAGAEDALAAEDPPTVDNPPTADNPATVEDPPARDDVPSHVAVSTADEASATAEPSATGDLSLADAATADEVVEAPPVEDAMVDDRLSNYGRAEPLAIAYHLDILSGINQGRRLDLRHPRVVLGFNQERLVEIVKENGALVVRAIGSEGEALLNGEPMDERPTPVGSGDILSVQRIELQVQQRVRLDDDRTGA